MLAVAAVLPEGVVGKGVSQGMIAACAQNYAIGLSIKANFVSDAINPDGASG